MRVQMKRRFHEGVRLSQEQFGALEWTRGMLQLDWEKGREVLGLYESGPGHVQDPYGLLWNPRVIACYSDTISFSGIERLSKQFVHQTWYCEIGRGSRGPG